MKVSSVAESITSEDGYTQIAFDLSGSEPGYLLIAKPDDASQTSEFFGQDHYVEVKDQVFGRYGGLIGLRIVGNNEIDIDLAYEVTGVGNTISVATQSAMDPEILSCLRTLQRG